MLKGACTPGCMYLRLVAKCSWELHSTPIHQAHHGPLAVVLAGSTCCPPVLGAPSRARLQTAPARMLKDRCGLWPPCSMLQVPGVMHAASAT